MYTVHKKLKKRELHHYIFYGCLVTIPLLQFLVMYVGVNVNSVLLAFQKYEGGEFMWNGLNTFKEAFTDLFTTKSWASNFGNAFLIWALGLLLKTPIGLIISYFIYKCAGKISNLFRVILFAPTIISNMVLVVTFQYFCESAVPELLLRLTGKNYGPFLFSNNPTTRFITIFVFTYWSGFGSSMLLYVNAMNGISESIVEAAQLDGVSFMQEFIHITFPMIFSTFATMFTVGFVGILGNQMMLFEFYGLDGALTQNYTVGYYLYQRTMVGGRSAYPLLSAFGLIFTVVWIPITLLVRKGVNRLDPMN